MAPRHQHPESMRNLISERSARIRWGWLLPATIVAVALAAIACGGGDSSGPRNVSIQMSDELSFAPAEITAKVGEPVRLSIENTGTALHDFSVDEIEVDDVMSEGGVDSGGHGGGHSYDLHIAVEGGEAGTLEFTPLEPGKYEYTCTESGHAEGGMTGMLIVTS